MLGDAMNRIVVDVEALVQTEPAIQHVGADERGRAIPGVLEDPCERRGAGLEDDAVVVDAVHRRERAGHDRDVDGSVSGTTARALSKRAPFAASASIEGVRPRCSRSARSVSMVIRTTLGWVGGGGVVFVPHDHRPTAAATAKRTSKAMRLRNSGEIMSFVVGVVFFTRLGPHPQALVASL